LFQELRFALLSHFRGAHVHDLKSVQTLQRGQSQVADGRRAEIQKPKALEFREVSQVVVSNFGGAQVDLRHRLDIDGQVSLECAAEGSWPSVSPARSRRSISLRRCSMASLVWLLAMSFPLEG